VELERGGVEELERGAECRAVSEGGMGKLRVGLVEPLFGGLEIFIATGKATYVVEVVKR
jgi:hypothetical protein